MPLLDRHIAFVEALRTAGLPVSLSEDLDGVRAVTTLGLGDREDVRAALAASLVKRQGHRPTFDTVFDLFFPALLGSGTSVTARPAKSDGSADHERQVGEGDVGGMRDAVVEAMAEGDGEALEQLARQSVEQFGAMPGRPRGMSSWSSYNTMQKLGPDALVLRLAEALMRGGDDREPRSEDLAMLGATRRVDDLRRLVETDVRRRIAEEKDPAYVARTTLRPSLDQVAFLNARQSDVEEMRRQIYPLARRLAARLAREQHARRRGPLDFRRTVRASVSTGGVPLVTHHRPRRPHRPELVVLCDVSGSVASFASFTLLLVYALREQFGRVRAFTFVDDVHEVTDEFVPGADLEDTLTRLAASARHASMFGRTSYGRAFQRFGEKYPDALGPRTSLLVLGDARSNYTDPQLETFRAMVAASRRAWWFNPESRGQWDTGDSAAREYGAVVPMLECRNLTQLAEVVHDLV